MSSKCRRWSSNCPREIFHLTPKTQNSFVAPSLLQRLLASRFLVPGEELGLVVPMNVLNVVVATALVGLGGVSAQPEAVINLPDTPFSVLFNATGNILYRPSRIDAIATRDAAEAAGTTDMKLHGAAPIKLETIDATNLIEYQLTDVSFDPFEKTNLYDIAGTDAAAASGMADFAILSPVIQSYADNYIPLLGKQFGEETLVDGIPEFLANDRQLTEWVVNSDEDIAAGCCSASTVIEQKYVLLLS